MATSNLRFRIIGEDDASGAFLRAAASADAANSAFSGMGASALSLGTALGASGLLPIAAGATAAIASLGTSLAAAGGALGVFTLSAGSMVKSMATQQQAITATQTSLSTLTKGTTSYQTALAKLHTQQSIFTKDFGPAAKGFTDMKSAFTGFQQATKPVTEGVLARGFHLIADVLPKLVPVSNAAGKAVGGLIGRLTHWVNGPEFPKLLKWLETSGPKAITDFGVSIGHIAHGVGEFFSNFIGPGNRAAHSMVDLSKAFDKWAGSKGVSAGVQRFLDYVHKNGPQITAVLVSLAKALPRLVSALGQVGTFSLFGVAKALSAIAGLSPGKFRLVADGLLGIYAAMKLLTIVQGVSAGIAVMTAAFADLQAMCLGTRIGLAALWVTEKIGVIATKAMAAAQWLLTAAMDANPIGLVVVAIAALAAGLIYAYKHSATFRAMVQVAFHDVAVAARTAFHAVEVAASTVFNWIKDHWPLLLATLGGPVGLAVVLIIKNFRLVEDAIRMVGDWARWLWNNAFQPALKFIVQGLSVLLNMWGHMLTALGHVPGFGWATGAGKALESAANKALRLANSINKIPSQKTVTVDMVTNVIHNVIHTTGGHVPAPTSRGSVGRVTTGAGRSAGLTYGTHYASTSAYSSAAQDSLGTITVVVKNESGQEIERSLVKLRRQRGGAPLRFE